MSLLQRMVYSVGDAEGGSGNEDILDVALVDNDKVSKMPLLGSGMQPGFLVFGCHSEQDVHGDKVFLHGLAQQQEAVVHSVNALSAKHPNTTNCGPS